MERDFVMNGWIGTVVDLPTLKKIQIETQDEADSDGSMTISDNRISIYSRNKLGEYDILHKIKNNKNNEAYVVGELFIDIFEDDSLADMAISNRRGYDEGDSRYIEALKIVKKLVAHVVDKKDNIKKEKKLKEENDKVNEIKKGFKNPRSRTILENKLDEREREILEEESMQFARAINMGKETKKFFISHKEEHKEYGKFIVTVLENYGIDVKSSVIFTSDIRLGVPQGKDIHDYLKSCFRENLMVIFLFSKAFYDSNICIAEAGAAWATNKYCLNVIIDIDFGDVDKPSNSALSSMKFYDFNKNEQKIALQDFFKRVLEDGLNAECDEERLAKIIDKTIVESNGIYEFNREVPLFMPKRKFLPMPNCPTCRNKMDIKREYGKIVFKCKNVACNTKLSITI